MKKTLILILSLCTCLLLCLALVACGGQQQEPDKPDESLNYSLIKDGTEYEVSGIGSCTDTDLVIPSTYKGLPVTSIRATAFDLCMNLTSVNIPDSVTSIGSRAFSRCINLTRVTIGKSVTSIDDIAFEYCYKLVEVVNKSESILVTRSTTNGGVGIYALAIYNFFDTFTGTKLSNDNGYIVYTDNSKKILMGYQGKETDLTLPSYITEIYNYAFLDCRSLTSVTIPDNVTSIGYNAFTGCRNLTSVTIPDNVTSIGSSAFSACSSLTSVNIPDSVTSIGSWAFLNCINLTRVTIGKLVTSIDNEAFDGCFKLVEVVNKSESILVTRSDTNGGVGKCALAIYNSFDTFTGTKLSNDNGYIVYTDNSKKILMGYQGKETDLTLPSYITEINSYAFTGCSSLTNVTIPDNVTSIGYNAFTGCRNLTSVTFINTIGWSSNDPQFSSSILENASAAALYLKEGGIFSIIYR